ncbi:N-glycosylase/DNA lyase [Centruroides vittatus]|uniref:N-glycosylase/DNA lyase n=1 Tax=Centruroides vittatus TaxID=120091 RepID=UPI00350EF1AA
MCWKVIPCNFQELNLDITLTCGQSFRWKRAENGEWVSVFSNVVWMLKQDKDGNLNYKAYDCEKNMDRQKSKRRKLHLKDTVAKSSDRNYSDADHENVLREYFQLKVNLTDLYRDWSERDDKFNNISKIFSGVRILKQDPVENLISFICSSNNNIPRITSMVEKLCFHYGEGLEINDEMFYTFPSLEKLAEAKVEGELRKLGFGYRAKYINQTAARITKNDPNWLMSLRNISYKDARKELLQLPGVGGKVADCVCLMSLDKSEAVPIDTHVWQIATRDYLPHLKTKKTMTDKIYLEIGNFFRNRFGKYAGWAHSVLFAADLPQFKHLRN